MFWFMLIGLILLSSLACFYKCFYSENKKTADPYALLHGQQYEAVKDEIYRSTKIMDEAKFEHVTIRSYDGTPLSGRYYHSRDGAPVKILFHGYRSMALRDSAGGFGMAKKLGFNILAVDQRAHGLSGGHVITFGIKERQDCRCWSEYIYERFGKDVPIILSGLSMGAATVIMATQLPLPPSVVCVMADCPYSSPREIICKVSEDLKVPAWLAYPLIWVGAFLFGGFNLNSASALEAAAQSKIPILLLHGEDDQFVPCEMSRKIHQLSNGCTQLATFPEAGHGLSYMIDPVGYEKVCFTFLRSVPALNAFIGVSDFTQSAP